MAAVSMAVVVVASIAVIPHEHHSLGFLGLQHHGTGVNCQPSTLCGKNDIRGSRNAMNSTN